MNKAFKPRRVGMTPRQRQVFDLVASGKSYEEVASILGMLQDCVGKTFNAAKAASKDVEEVGSDIATPAAFAKVDREIAQGLRCSCALLLPCHGGHTKPADFAGARRGDETTVNFERVSK